MEWSDIIEDFGAKTAKWFHAGSNILLDFHGDPMISDIAVFSDGNHNMALRDTLERFRQQVSETLNYFYVTTPPGPIVELLRTRLQLGNFILSIKPHIFLGPWHIIERLIDEGYVTKHFPFVRNQGSVLLVKNGNPKNILSVVDLKREGMTLFLSNPETEQTSFQGYVDTLVNISEDPNIMEKIQVVYGTKIHHREAPESVITDRADAAFVYYHLGLHFLRLYPDAFDMVPLGGDVENPEPFQGNIKGTTHAARIGSGGKFGTRFLQFLASEEVKAIYRYHGLVPVGI